MARRESPAMRHGESLYRSEKEKQLSGQRRNCEQEPFLVEEMSGSPVIRGRNRRNSVEEPVAGSVAAAAPPTAREVASEDEELFIRKLPATSVMTEAPARGSRVAAEITRKTTADQHGRTMRATWRIIDDRVDDGSRRDGPEDRPPSYEASVPPDQIGWSLDPTSVIPSATSSSIAARDDHENLLAFAYLPTSPTSPPIQLSPQAETYLWMASSDSRSLLTALPSQSPSSDRLRPAYYTYQQQRAVQIVRATPMRLTRDYENERGSSDKPYNDFSHKYGGIVIAIFFIVFMMVLSLAVKFLIGNSLS